MRIVQASRVRIPCMERLLATLIGRSIFTKAAIQRIKLRGGGSGHRMNRQPPRLLDYLIT